MSQPPKTIQIFLPDGEPSGIRIAELTTRIVQAVAVPRNSLGDFFKRPEVNHIATYFLFGGLDAEAKPVAYIGQTEDLKKRLKKHDGDKEFWSIAVILVSRTHSFTQAHIKWLEWFGIALATEAKRYRLENGNSGSEPFVTEPIHADLKEIFETGSLLLDALGFPIFRSVGTVKPTDSEEPIQEFYAKGPDANAKGVFTNEGFVILKGSTCRKQVTPSGKDKITHIRNKFISDGVLIEEGKHLTFTEDTLFKSPSGAAIVVLGRAANGWTTWVNKSGQSLDELKRENS